MATDDPFHVPPLFRMAHRRLLLAEERERRMASHFEERLGPEAGDLIAATRADHAPMFGPCRPEDLLGPEGPGAGQEPHDFFDEAFRGQTLREAAVMAALLERFGDEVEVEARLCAYDHGWEVGERVAGSRGVVSPTPEQGFDLLADHFPGGEGCRPAVRLRSADEGEVVWETYDRETLARWERAGLTSRLMSNINAFWCKGFGEALHGDGGTGLEFRSGKGMADGEPTDEGRYLRA